MRWRAVLAVLAGLAAAACSPTGSGDIPLTVYAAASLKDAVGAAAAAYEAANPGTTITLSTDSSAALETQIEQGAPADVFLSADSVNPQKLVDAGFASGGPVPIAGNELAIVVPRGNPGGVTSPLDLARDGLTIIAAGEEVPITRYATELVERLARQSGAAVDFQARYAANVASREDNVSAVLGKIEVGEGDAGIVYVTDAKAADGVETVVIPPAANVRATYAGVVVGASPNRAAAAAFLHWLAGPGGQAVLADFGFLAPPS
jgi:molybdate transport system substrate-binding protein